MIFDEKACVSTPPYNHKGFTLLVNPLRSVSRLLLGAHPTSILPVQGGRTIPKEHRCGFTLAETLITLVIVGVVAALTVPTLITKYQKEQTVTKLKKVYSALSQTTQKAIADNGPINTWEIGEHASPEASKAFADKYLIPYLNVMKNCGNDTSDECKFERITRKPSNPTELNEKYSRFFLNDGSLIGVYIYNKESLGVRALIYIDINGQKKPNIVGRDYFELSYNLVYPNDTSLEGKFIPIGINKTREELKTSDCNKNNYGYHCFSLILKDGWQIKDDYPW